MVAQFPGPAARVILSADRMCANQIDDEEMASIPVEFLNTLNPPGIPDHKLTLKVGDALDPS